MRFIVLIALLGIAAASCPYNFNQLIQGNQHHQNQNQNDLYDEDDNNDYQGQQHHNQYQQGQWQDDDQDDQDDDDEDQLSGLNNQQGRHHQGGRHQGGRHHQDQDDEEDEDNQQGSRHQGGRHQGGHHQQDQDDEDDENDEDYNQQGRHHQGGRHQGGRQHGGRHQGGRHHQQQQPNHHLLQQLEQPNAHLAAKLYKQAKQQQDDKNTVVSPAAVQLTLAALHKGAKGNTKAQIKHAQCPHLSHQQCQHAHAALIRSLKGSNNVQQTQKPGHHNSHQNAKINVANAIILNQQNQAQQHFVQAVQQGLGGQVKHCSFKHNHQQCRQQINHLVKAKTNHKIQNIIPQHAVTGNTKMIAVSALQLQAKWGHQFRQNQITTQGRFHPLGSQHQKHVQVIQSQGRFNYYEDNQVQVVGIPTQQQELTLYVILPQEQDGLTQVEKEQVQNGEQLQQLLDNCDQQKHHVQVQLPKFQISHKIDAKHTLSHQQGVQDAFEHDHADFSGIDGQHQQQQQNPSKKIHLNKLIHHATIKINEQGISSANTGSQSSQQDQQDQQDNEYGSHHQRQHNQHNQHNQHGQGNQLIADHAFAFAIKHNPSNQIILVGRVIDAAQKPQGHHQQGHHGLHQGQDQE